jgi:hypothetical protein
MIIFIFYFDINKGIGCSGHTLKYRHCSKKIAFFIKSLAEYIAAIFLYK